MTKTINKLTEMKKTMTYRELEDILDFNARTIEGWIVGRTRPFKNSLDLIKMSADDCEYAEVESSILLEDDNTIIQRSIEQGYVPTMIHYI